MQILYLAQIEIDLNISGIYSDLIKSLIGEGHDITVVTATAKEKSGVDIIGDMKVVHIKLGEQYGVGIVKKGLVILSLEKKIIKGIKKYLSDDKFDLVLYATPPVTLANVVKFSKKKYGCKSYLMLKDIFPQNAVDIGLMSTGGLTGILYKMFRKKEINLYKRSDKIGCMSQANIDYLIKHNPYLDVANVELFPNAVSEKPEIIKNKSILNELNVDGSKLTFIYGGNLGKPQGLDFLAKALLETADCDCNFVIVGNGQEKDKLFKAVDSIKNVYTFDYLPQEEYIQLCASCDVGMIVLDYRFSIPNYPSRILSYMQNSMPIFAATDNATDIKSLVEQDANCGKWCCSDDTLGFKSCVEWFIDNKDKLSELGKQGREYLNKNFTTKICVAKITRFMQEENKNV